MSINQIDTNEEKLKKQMEMSGVQGVNPFAPAQGSQPVAPANPLENKDIFTAEKEGMGQKPQATPSGAPIDVMAIFGFQRTTAAQAVTKPDEADKPSEINGTLNAQKPQTLSAKNDEVKAELEGKTKTPTIEGINETIKITPQEKVANAPIATASNAGSSENLGQKTGNEGQSFAQATVATPISDKTAPPPTPKNTQSSTGSENSANGVNPANSSDINPNNVNTENSLQDQTQKLLKFGRPANT